VWEGVNWMHLAQDKDLLGCCEYGNEASVSINGGKFVD
jgi:hypothetical protein